MGILTYPERPDKLVRPAAEGEPFDFEPSSENSTRSTAGGGNRLQIRTFDLI